MSAIRVELVQGKELVTAYHIAAYAFSDPPKTEEQLEAFIKYHQEDFGLIVYEGDNPVSGLLGFPMQQNIRGNLFSVCGIEGVATYPTNRYQGHVKSLFNTLFTVMKEKGFVCSMLYPFKDKFYEALGYASFPQIRQAIFSPQSLVPLISKPIPGSVTRYSIADCFDTYIQLLEEKRDRTHGFGILPRSQLTRLRDKKAYWCAIAKDGAKPIGAMLYKNTGYLKEMEIIEFNYLNSTAKYLLLQFIAKHTDQVRQIQLPVAPYEVPELWVNDTFGGYEQKIHTNPSYANPMGRIINVNSLQGLRVGTGKINIKIKDDHCPWNNQIFSFQSKKGTLNISSDSEYAFELTIHGLSALLYGCYTLSDFPYKGWGMIPPSLNSAITQLFPPKSPYLHAGF